MIKTILAFSIWTMCAFNSYSALALEPNLESDDPYEILGVDPSASDDEITKAWKALAIRYHPDNANGDESAFKIVTEAYQFLKEHRQNFDDRIYPFKGVFRRGVLVPIETVDESRFQMVYKRYLWWESAARERAGENSGRMPAFLLYAILNLNGEYTDYDKFERYQLRAYRELAGYVGLLSLTKSERAGILLKDPVQALEKLLEHYDNFNVRLSTIHELFFAYNSFYLSKPGLTDEFIALFEKMTQNRMIFDRRYEAIKTAAVKSFKKWMADYFDQPRAIRREYRDLYIRTKKLLNQFETFPKSMLTSCQLTLSIRPRIEDPF